MRSIGHRSLGIDQALSPLERILANPAVDRPTLFKLAILGFAITVPLAAMPLHADPLEESISAAQDTGPIVAIVQPAYNDQLKGTTQIVVGVQTRRYSVQTFELFVDGRSASNGPVSATMLSLPSATFDWNTKLYADGTHKLLVRVTDSQGFIGQSEVTIYINNNGLVDGTPPSLAWVSAPHDPLHGHVKIQLATIDSFGVKWLIATMKAKGASQGKTPLKSWILNQPPYTINLDTTTVADGDYILSALAYDSMDNEGEAPPLTITVANSAAALDDLRKTLEVMQKQTNPTVYGGDVGYQSSPPAPVNTGAPATTMPDLKPTVPMSPAAPPANMQPLASQPGTGGADGSADPTVGSERHATNLETVPSNPAPSAPAPAVTVVTGPPASKTIDNAKTSPAPKPAVIAPAGTRVVRSDAPSPLPPSDTRVTVEFKGATTDASATVVSVGPLQPAPRDNAPLFAFVPRTVPAPETPPTATVAEQPTPQALIAAPAYDLPATHTDASATLLASAPQEDQRTIYLGDPGATTAPGAGGGPVTSREAAPTADDSTPGKPTYLARSNDPVLAPRAELAPPTLSPVTGTTDATPSFAQPAQIRLAGIDAATLSSVPSGHPRTESQPVPNTEATTALVAEPTDTQGASALSPRILAPVEEQAPRATRPAAMSAPLFADASSSPVEDGNIAPAGSVQSAAPDSTLPGAITAVPSGAPRRVFVGDPSLSVASGQIDSAVLATGTVKVIVPTSQSYFAAPTLSDSAARAVPVAPAPVVGKTSPAVRTAASTSEPSRAVSAPAMTPASNVETRRAGAVTAEPSSATLPSHRVQPTLPRYVMLPPASLPRRAVIAAAITVSPTSMVNANPIPEVYVTRRDESLFAVAMRFDVPLTVLAVSNRLTPVSHLKAGTSVRMPRPLTVSYHGKPVTGDVGSLMVGSTAVTPFRFLFQQEGGDIEWDAKLHRVTARNSSEEVTINIGSRTAIVNNREQMMDLAAFLLSGRTMVPVRFFEKAMHAQVEWEPSTGRLFVAMANP